jgi:hypothetical protein
MLAVLAHPAAAQAPPGTVFTYQGRLKDAGSPANGLHDLRFRLFDAFVGGGQVGATLCADDVSVTDGLFTLALDFGAQFAGQERFLEIEVRADTGLDCANATGFVTLAPRQALTAAPYAMFSAGPWQTNAGNLFYTSGTVGIGTSNPTALLSVQGGGLHVFDNANQGIALATNSFSLTNASNEDPVYQYNFSNDRHTWLTGGSEHMVLNNLGRVGIGTTTPGTRLDVMGGSIRASDQLISTIATGTSPLSVNSTTTVTNLSADLLDGLDSTSFLQSIPVPLTLSGTSATHIIRGENASTTTGASGIHGRVSGATGMTFGVFGQSDSTSGRGVFGLATTITGTNYGVFGQSGSRDGAGFGVWAQGRLGASGTKSFRIDHPDDPANKYLLHYAAESPEVINFYRGTVVLDGAGGAVVELPHYFAKINKTPSYQLTAVGAPMPMLHVAEEIDEAALIAGAAAGPGDAAPACSFRVAGGAPGAKVSWEVKALRNDRWVQQRGAPVEVEKEGTEKGSYQHPELYGQPAEMGMNYRPELEHPERERSSPPTLPDGEHPSPTSTGATG